MHLVTKSYFESFTSSYGSPYELTKNFEAFANFCVFNKFAADQVDPYELVYEGADPGIDGAMVFLGDRAVFTVEELEELLSASKREFEVTFVFTQVKTSTSWTKTEIDSFVSNLVDFLSENPAQPHSEFLANIKSIFQLIYKNIGRVHGGLPNLEAYFVSAAEETSAVEIVAAFDVGVRALRKTGYFKAAEFHRCHRDFLHSLWIACGGTVEANLPTIGYAPFPAAPAVNNAYVATVTARDFIDAVLKNSDGTFRKKLFEENVRDFLGVDAEVNSEIASTLGEEDRKRRFGLMNNGVTIVAASVRPSGQEIFIRDFQIVNGCQTSNVLIACDQSVDKSVSLMVKLIEASDPSVIDDIVRATNRQSKVEDAQFASTLSFLRDLEQYFNARGKDQASRIYFERRRGQYAAENLPQVRVFDVREAARCYAAVSMMRPDLASRYPNRLTGDLLDEVFKKGNSEELYYVSCFAHYRLRMLISNKRLDARYSKLRWHILTATWKFCGVHFKSLGYKKREELFVELFSSNEGGSFDMLSGLVATSIPNPNISRDVLKGQAITGSILAAVDNYAPN
jgi:hypothetical protein